MQGEGGRERGVSVCVRGEGERQGDRRAVTAVVAVTAAEVVISGTLWARGCVAR